MPPHTCECKTCGFQWRRDDFLDVAENKTKVDNFQRNLGSVNDVSVKESNARSARKVNYSGKTGYDIVNEVLKSQSTVEGKTQERKRNTGRVVTDVKITANDDSDVVRVTRSKRGMLLNNEDDTFESAPNVKRNVRDSKIRTTAGTIDKHNRRSANVKLEATESSSDAVKEVTAMLDNSLVIPEGDIIAEQEVIVKFELDEETERAVTEDVQYLNEEYERKYGKGRGEKENIGTKSHERAAWFPEVKNMKYSEEKPTGGPLPHNMPGKKILDYFSVKNSLFCDK